MSLLSYLLTLRCYLLGSYSSTLFVENKLEFSSIPVYFTFSSDPGKLYPVKPESSNTLAEPFICLADPK